jgi:subtilase family serine protease
MLLHAINPHDRNEVVSIAKRHNLKATLNDVNIHSILITALNETEISSSDEEKFISLISHIPVTSFSKNIRSQKNILMPRYRHGPKIDASGNVIAMPKNNLLPERKVPRQSAIINLTRTEPKSFSKSTIPESVKSSLTSNANITLEHKLKPVPRPKGYTRVDVLAAKLNSVKSVQQPAKPTVVLPQEFVTVSDNSTNNKDNNPTNSTNAHAERPLIANAAPRVSPYFKPTELSQIYNFPPLPTKPQTIAIIELGGGFVPADLTYYWRYVLNYTEGQYPVVNSISVNGATNNPGLSDDDYEVVLDIEVIGGCYPGVIMNVYFAPNTLNGFYNAIQMAIANNATNAISISWGASEKSYGGVNNLNAFNQLFAIAVSKGITIFAASGDNGASNGLSGLNVDFPASSPNVIGCGGTRLTCPSRTYKGSGTLEPCWNYTGGGFSSVFSPPLYQVPILKAQFNNITRRAVPDVTGNADPTTGWVCYLRGSLISIGGTSAVSPMWSALHARMGKKQFAGPKLYAAYKSNAYNDILRGNNKGYQALANFDCTSGLGSPNGANLKLRF